MKMYFKTLIIILVIHSGASKMKAQKSNTYKLVNISRLRYNLISYAYKSKFNKLYFKHFSDFNTIEKDSLKKYLKDLNLKDSIIYYDWDLRGDYFVTNPKYGIIKIIDRTLVINNLFLMRVNNVYSYKIHTRRYKILEMNENKIVLEDLDNENYIYSFKK